MKMTRQLYVTGFLAWFVGGLYYLYQYILRVSPMVMVDEVRSDFFLDASAFGSLMAIGTYFYAALQIPVGILSDLFGARRTILLSLVACILGTAIFSYTETIFLAYVGRILIGLGSAAAFVSTSKISSDWFPAHQKPLWFAGIVVMGTMGAYLGGNPLAQMVSDYGWRESLYTMILVGIGVFIINLIFLKNRVHPSSEKEKFIQRQDLWVQIKTVFRSKYCWMYAITALGMYLTVSVFADLWGVQFLQNKFGMSRETAAFSISTTYFGVCAGVIVLSFVSQLLPDSRPIIGISAFLIVFLLSIITYYDNLSVTSINIIMFMIGAFVGGEILCFAQACEHMPTSVAATVTGFLNFVITIGAAFTQQLFGFILDFFWDGQTGLDGSRLYSTADYQEALFIVILISASSVVLSFFLPPDIPKQNTID